MSISPVFDENCDLVPDQTTSLQNDNTLIENNNCLLVERGIKPNTSALVDALCLAIQDEKLSEIENLLQTGAPINGTRSKMPIKTSIMSTTNTGIFYYLLSMGASITVPYGFTLAEMIALGSQWSLADKCAALDALHIRGLTLLPIHFAAVRGDMQMIIDEIERGNLFQIDTQGNNLAIYLSACGRLELLIELQSRNALLLQKNYEGSTPLLFAADSGHLSVVQWLLTEAGAQITERTIFGSSALLMAARNNHFELVKWLLIEGKAKIDERNDLGRTALISAAFFGSLCYLPLVKWLVLEGGASVTETDNEGYSAAYYATLSLEAVQWMVRHHGSTDFGNKKASSILVWSAGSGMLCCVRWLLQEGGASITETHRGRTALLAAAHYGKLDVIIWLLQHGASLKEVNEEGATALLEAASGGHIGTAEWLLKCGGATLDETDKCGFDALYCAAWYGEMDMVKYLVQEAKANVTRSAAVVAAATNGHLEILQWLLRNGARVTDKDKSGRIAIMSAASQGHLQVVQWLVKHVRASVFTSGEGSALVQAVRSGHQEVAQWLVYEGGSEISEVDHLGWSVPMAALGFVNIVQWLVEHCNVDVSDQSLSHAKFTLAIAAANEGYLTTLKYLLRNGGSNLKEVTKDGSTALTVALRKGHVHVVTCLLVDFDAAKPEDLGHSRYRSQARGECIRLCRNVALLHATCIEYDVRQQLNIIEYATREILHLFPSALQGLVNEYNERSESELGELHASILKKNSVLYDFKFKLKRESWVVARKLVQTLMQIISRNRPCKMLTLIGVLREFMTHHAPALEHENSLKRVLVELVSEIECFFTSNRRRKTWKIPHKLICRMLSLSLN